MKELIDQITSQLGVPESNASAATSGVLELIQNNAGEGDFKELLSKLPGASSLLEQSASSGAQQSAAGGLLGGVLGAAASGLGGKLGAAVGLMDVLGKSGIGSDQSGNFLSLFMNFVKSKAGGELLGRVLGNLPELKNSWDNASRF